MKEASSQWSNCYSLIIGLIIGCFIQFSSLGANFLMTTMYGNDVFFMKVSFRSASCFCSAGKD